MKTNFKNTVGLIGIGLVGTQIATNLINKGYNVMGFDIDPMKMTDFQKLGGICAQSPLEVGKSSERIILSLLKSEIVEKVIWGNEGILSSIKNKEIITKLIIDTTTGDPILTEKIAENLKKTNIQYLDATISGSSVQIGNKKGVFMIGGNEDVFRENLDLFEALAEKSIYAGTSGSGSRAKLAVNLIVGLNRLVLAEGLVFAEKMNLDLKQILEIFRETQAYSRILDAKGEKMISDNFETQSRIKQHRKDVSLMLKMAKSFEGRLPLSQLHFDLLTNMMEKGEGDLDVSSVIKEIRRQVSMK